MKLFYTFKISFLTLLLLFLSSCSQVKKEDQINQKKETGKSLIKHAKGLDIQIFEDYTKLIIKSPYPDNKNQQKFILVSQNNLSKVQNITGKKIIIPLKKIIATSTTHIPMLELIEEENSLIGFPNVQYISSQKTVKRIESGYLKDIGNNLSLNTEILLELQPDAIIAFSTGNTSKMYRTIEKNGIPVIFNGDWLEETPLGRAEWLKFFGALYNKNKEADSIFKNIEVKYKKASKIAKNAKNTPTIFTGVLYKDKWNLPAGESFVAQLYKDANINYLWKNTKGQGALFLSFESVLAKAKTADYWLGAGYFTSYSELKNANIHYKEFDAFTNKHTYTYSKNTGKNGGVKYFEFAPIQPHIVLQDLIKVTHPELLPNYTPYFLEKLDK